MVEKGIFPEWMGDKETIDLILRFIVSNYGQIPYTFIVNPENKPETQERLERILNIMEEENLITHSKEEVTLLKLTADGRLAIEMGYKKFKRFRRWRKFSVRQNPIKYFFAITLFICLLLFILYLKYH